MLNDLQPELRELLDLVRAAENYDATLAASYQLGKPIQPAAEAVAERERKAQRATHRLSAHEVEPATPRKSMAFKRYCARCGKQTEHHDDQGVLRCSLCVW